MPKYLTSLFPLNCASRVVSLAIFAEWKNREILEDGIHQAKIE